MNRVRRRPIAVLALAALALAAFQQWKRGTPHGEPDWSPNRQYYVQHYANASPSRYLPRPPGDGAAHDGYVRLFDRRGRLLREKFFTTNRYVRPVWAGRTLYLQTGHDDLAWPLPTPAE